MSVIRKFLKSSYGPEGRLVEIDFSQLEIFVLAHLSGDPTLKSDLISGKDLHGLSAEKLFGSKYTPKQRDIAKRLSFQLQYGSGAKNMAEKLEVPLDLAEQFIKNYYDRYPDVKAYQDSLITTVKKKREPSSHRTQKGYPAGISTLTSETGRVYTFIEKDAPDWMARPRHPGAVPTSTSFSPTQIKNYPVQGYATGDIVPIVLGKLFRAKNSYNTRVGKEIVKMVNTVHDSVLFDCNSEATAKHWAHRAAAVMQKAPQYLKEIFDIDFTMPLKVEVEIGENWLEMEKYEL